MALEIIPKKEEAKRSPGKTTAWYGGLFFLLLALSSVALVYLLTWKTEGQIDEVSAELRARKNPDIIKLEAEMEESRLKAVDFASIIDKRVSPEKLLEVIENNIHPDVYLTDLSIDIDGRTLSGGAVAKDIVAFEQQKMIFKGESKIVSDGIDKFTRGEGGRVSFSINIVFREELFNPNSEL